MYLNQHFEADYFPGVFLGGKVTGVKFVSVRQESSEKDARNTQKDPGPRNQNNWISSVNSPWSSHYLSIVY